MSNRTPEVTKQAIVARQANGMCRMLDQILKPDETGVIQTSLEGGVDVTLNLTSRQITVQGNGAAQVTRTYNVGHPTHSGQVTEIQLSPIVIKQGGSEVTRVSLNLDGLKVAFPDGQSHLTIRGGTRQESITLF